VKAQVLSGGADVVDVTCADFDGVSFHGEEKKKNKKKDTMPIFVFLTHKNKL
jgi:hypothetical protein